MLHTNKQDAYVENIRELGDEAIESCLEKPKNESRAQTIA